MFIFFYFLLLLLPLLLFTMAVLHRCCEKKHTTKRKNEEERKENGNLRKRETFMGEREKKGEKMGQHVLWWFCCRAGSVYLASLLSVSSFYLIFILFPLFFVSFLYVRKKKKRNS